MFVRHTKYCYILAYYFLGERIYIFTCLMSSWIWLALAGYDAWTYTDTGSENDSVFSEIQDTYTHMNMNVDL